MTARCETAFVCTDCFSIQAVDHRGAEYRPKRLRLRICQESQTEDRLRAAKRWQIRGLTATVAKLSNSFGYCLAKAIDRPDLTLGYLECLSDVV